MSCDYCGAPNPHPEERCPRCGRRRFGPARTTDLRVDGALATQPHATPAAGFSESSRSRDLSNAVQPRLFYDRPAPNVIPFEAFAPPPPARPARRQRSSGAKTPTRSDIPSKPVAKATRSGSRRAPAPETQGRLDFLPPATPKPRTLGTTVEASIYCEAPVATPLHRSLAAAADWSMVLIGYGVFLIAFRLLGGAFITNKIGLAVLGGALPLIAIVYGLIFAIARSETAGMRWMHLELVTFDGERPEGRAWLWRFLGSLLSHATVFGLFWTFVDEESLGMQDHISSTFPTPRESNCQVFLQR